VAQAAELELHDCQENHRKGVQQRQKRLSELMMQLDGGGLGGGGAPASTEEQGEAQHASVGSQVESTDRGIMESKRGNDQEDEEWQDLGTPLGGSGGGGSAKKGRKKKTSKG